MINFIPRVFGADENTCPVCVARTALEAQLELEQASLDKLGIKLLTAGLPEDAANAYFELQKCFRAFLSHYRVAFAINLAIWFSAERFGRTKKVPDLILAYDEYRAELVGAFEAYTRACEGFFTVVDQSEMGAEHQNFLSATCGLNPTYQAFLAAVDSWTVKRREEALALL